MTLLIINQSDDFDKSLTATIDDGLGDVLFKHCQPLFEKTMVAESFWLDDYLELYHNHNVIDFSDLPDDVFMKTYDLIDDFKKFEIHQKEIKQKMQADPRYNRS
ncbi:MAG: hypothetical protein Q4B81_08275 [Moraxella sp.]|nr:hypothetical protein [Moraxella sp.]